MTVRLELTIDRDTDYLELSDPLAPFMVPLQVFEGMKTVQGVDYYQVEDHRGASFYINHAVKGKYVFEYTVVAGHCGRYSVGECQLYCNGTLEEKGIPDAKNIRVDERKP